MAAMVLDFLDPDGLFTEKAGFLRWVSKEMKLHGSRFDLFGEGVKDGERL